MSARRRKLAFKYVVRRAVLLLLAAAVLVLCGLLAVRAVQKARGGGESSAAESEQSPAVSSERTSEPETEQESSDSQPDEPEPIEPEPVTEPPESEETAAPPPDDDAGDWSLILVNAESPLPVDYAPPRLKHIVGEYSVDSRIAERLNRMFAAAKLNGVSLILCAAYQEDESEFQTGLAVGIASTGHREPDEGFADTPAFRWLRQHAWEYGFVPRYPRNKTSLTEVDFTPWHYRYVGLDNARRMTESDYCLEEYIYVLNQEKLRAAQEALQPEDDGEESSDESPDEE